MKRAKGPANGLVKNTLFLLRYVRQEDAGLLGLMGVETLCKVFMPFFGIYLPKLAIDLVTRGAPSREAILQLGLYTLAMGFVYCIGRYATTAQYFRQLYLHTYFMEDLFFQTLTCDYDEMESAQGQERYQKAMASLMGGDDSATSAMIPAITGLLVGLLGFVLYAGVLSTLHPLIVLALVFTSVCAYAAMRYAIRYERSKKAENGRLMEKAHYINEKSITLENAKDIRLYRMKRFFLDVRDTTLAQMIQLNKKVQRKWFFVNITDAVITLLRDGLAYAYLIYMVASRRMEAADFVFYFGAIAGFSAWLTSIFNQFSTIHGRQLEIGDIRDFLERRPRPDPDPAADAPDLAEAPSIEFDHVSFSYVDGQPVIRDFTLTIRPGEKIALVGVNGAGKTTLVKLLCGFYRPQSGVIRVGGVDIERYRRRDLYTYFSAVFQDMLVLPFSIGENVSMQSSRTYDAKQVEDSLARAGLQERIAQLPRGIETPMGRQENEDGIQLSGGQQQKLLLARALYKDAPALILDEPTAALDPIAESELYEQYHALTAGKTSIFISHRLASTRFCDRIVFLQDGKAAEVGSHQQLMELGGGYAEMYRIQSHYYQDDIKEVAQA